MNATSGATFGADHVTQPVHNPRQTRIVFVIMLAGLALISAILGNQFNIMRLPACLLSTSAGCSLITKDKQQPGEIIDGLTLQQPSFFVVSFFAALLVAAIATVGEAVPNSIKYLIRISPLIAALLLFELYRHGHLCAYVIALLGFSIGWWISIEQLRATRRASIRSILAFVSMLVLVTLLQSFLTKPGSAAGQPVNIAAAPVSEAQEKSGREVSTSTPPKDEAAVSDIVVGRTLAATVRVTNRARNAVGSGAIVAAREKEIYVMTAAHLAQKGDNIELRVLTPGKQSVKLSATVVASDPVDDLAMVRAEDDSADSLLALVAPGDYSDPVNSSRFPIVATGYLDDLNPSSLLDIVQMRRVRRPANELPVKVWEGEKSGFEGQSGGPMVDREGRLMGIRSGISGGKGYYIHLDAIHEFLRRNRLEWVLSSVQLSPPD